MENKPSHNRLDIVDKWVISLFYTLGLLVNSAGISYKYKEGLSFVEYCMLLFYLIIISLITYKGFKRIWFK